MMTLCENCPSSTSSLSPHKCNRRLETNAFVLANLLATIKCIAERDTGKQSRLQMSARINNVFRLHGCNTIVIDYNLPLNADMVYCCNHLKLVLFALFLFLNLA